MKPQFPAWQPIETAPRKGEEFLAYLSNGWIMILSEPHDIHNFSWYKTSSHTDVPIVRTHAEGTCDDSIRATHWMPLPEAPE